MSKKRYIDTSFWDDEYIRSLNPIERYIFLYFLTNPLTNIAGCYKITKDRILFDINISKEDSLSIDYDKLSKIMDRFQKDKKVYFIDGWILIKNFIKNQSLNSKTKIGIRLILEELSSKIKNIKINYDSLSIDYDSLLHLNIDSNIDSNLLCEFDNSLEKCSDEEIDKKDSLKENIKKNEIEKIEESKVKKKKNEVEKKSLIPEVIPDLLKDEQLHIRRIGLFAKFKSIKFTSKEHQSEFIKRNLRASKALNPYTDEQIIKTLAFLEITADYKITMETIGKYIDEDLDKLYKTTNGDKKKIAFG